MFMGNMCIYSGWDGLEVILVDVFCGCFVMDQLESVL